MAIGCGPPWKMAGVALVGAEPGAGVVIEQPSQLRMEIARTLVEAAAQYQDGH